MHPSALVSESVAAGVSRQIDLVVVTPLRAELIEIKTFTAPVKGGLTIFVINVPVRTLSFGGSARGGIREPIADEIPVVRELSLSAQWDFDSEGRLHRRKVRLQNCSRQAVTKGSLSS
jgi:hypothetical protein